VYVTKGRIRCGGLLSVSNVWGVESILVATRFAETVTETSGMAIAIAVTMVTQTSAKCLSTVNRL
jgi:hypothetical protein